MYTFLAGTEVDSWYLQDSNMATEDTLFIDIEKGDVPIEVAVSSGFPIGHVLTTNGLP